MRNLDFSIRVPFSVSTVKSLRFKLFVRSKVNKQPSFVNGLTFVSVKQKEQALRQTLIAFLT